VREGSAHFSLDEAMNQERKVRRPSGARRLARQSLDEATKENRGSQREAKEKREAERCTKAKRCAKRWPTGRSGTEHDEIACEGRVVGSPGLFCSLFRKPPEEKFYPAERKKQKKNKKIPRVRELGS